MDDLPLRGKNIKKATERDPVLSQAFNYTLHGWPDFERAAKECKALQVNTTDIEKWMLVKDCYSNSTEIQTESS